MKTETCKLGINRHPHGYDHIVPAGTYRIEKLKRTNVLGHGIVARGERGEEFTARTTGAAKQLIEREAARFAARFVTPQDSVLVVWRVQYNDEGGKR